MAPKRKKRGIVGTDVVVEYDEYMAGVIGENGLNYVYYRYYYTPGKLLCLGCFFTLSLRTG